jgi:SAM-dependent methyltransferase
VAEGRLDVRLGDAAALPWADATFDAVSNLAAFFAAHDPEAVLREAARVLKPGGRFVVVTMAAPAPDGRGGRFMRWLMPQAKLYRDEELAQMLEEAGFGQVEACSRGDGTQVGLAVRPS